MASGGRPRSRGLLVLPQHAECQVRRQPYGAVDALGGGLEVVLGGVVDVDEGLRIPVDECTALTRPKDTTEPRRQEETPQ